MAKKNVNYFSFGQHKKNPLDEQVTTITHQFNNKSLTFLNHAYY